MVKHQKILGISEWFNLENLEKMPGLLRQGCPVDAWRPQSGGVQRSIDLMRWGYTTCWSNLFTSCHYLRSICLLMFSKNPKDLIGMSVQKGIGPPNHSYDLGMGLEPSILFDREGSGSLGKVCDSGQIIATKPPVGRNSSKWWLSEGSFPKMSEKFRFRTCSKVICLDTWVILDLFLCWWFYLPLPAILQPSCGEYVVRYLYSLTPGWPEPAKCSLNFKLFKTV